MAACPARRALIEKANVFTIGSLKLYGYKWKVDNSKAYIDTYSMQSKQEFSKKNQSLPEWSHQNLWTIRLTPPSHVDEVLQPINNPTDQKVLWFPEMVQGWHKTNVSLPFTLETTFRHTKTHSSSGRAIKSIDDNDDDWQTSSPAQRHSAPGRIPPVYPKKNAAHTLIILQWPEDGCRTTNQHPEKPSS